MSARAARGARRAGTPTPLSLAQFPRWATHLGYPRFRAVDGKPREHGCFLAQKDKEWVLFGTHRLEAFFFFFLLWRSPFSFAHSHGCCLGFTLDSDPDVAAELGDVLWYATALSLELGGGAAQMATRLTTSSNWVSISWSWRPQFVAGFQKGKPKEAAGSWCLKGFFQLHPAGKNAAG